MDVSLKVKITHPSFEEIQGIADIPVTPAMNDRKVMNAAHAMLEELGWRKPGMTMNHIRWCAVKHLELQASAETILG